MTDPRIILRRLFDAALAAADPARCVAAHLPDPPRGRTVVIAYGKAAAAMARAVEQAWPGPLEGLAVTRTGHGLACDRIRVIEAAHPVPDGAGARAAAEALALARGLGPDDLLLALASGGGSALLALPAPGIALADKQAITRALLRSGAPIGAMNIVRRHLSAIKNGRLAAAAAPARVHSILISDVPGDDPAEVASGPTIADRSTPADAAAILARYGIEPPASVAAWLAGAAAAMPPPPAGTVAIAATAQDALAAAAAEARALGLAAHILSDRFEGEARALGAVHAAIARQVRGHGQPFAAPAVLLSGGETTVTVRGGGRGGRNLEFLLGFALAADGLPGVAALAADTDGIDGTEANAGAFALPDVLARARAAGLDPAAMLADNDGWTLFDRLGELVTTGPTRTNVNDFRAILIATEGATA